MTTGIKPYRITGLENLRTDAKRGLMLPKRTRFTPYEDVDENGNVIYVQKMPENIKQQRYTLLHLGELGLGQDYLKQFSEEQIRLALPERFGGQAPSLEEYSPEFEKTEGERQRTAWASILMKRGPTQPSDSAYEAYGRVHGQFGAENPLYAGGQALREQYGTQGAAFPGPKEKFPTVMPEVPGRPTITSVETITPENVDKYPGTIEGDNIAVLSNGQIIPVTEEYVKAWSKEKEQSSIIPMTQEEETAWEASMARLRLAQLQQPGAIPTPEIVVPGLKSALQSKEFEAARLERVRKSFEAVYPAGESIPNILDWLRDEDNTAKFVSYLQAVGPNEDTVGLLNELVPNITEAQARTIFGVPDKMPVDVVAASAPAFAAEYSNKLASLEPEKPETFVKSLQSFVNSLSTPIKKLFGNLYDAKGKEVPAERINQARELWQSQSGQYQELRDRLDRLQTAPQRTVAPPMSATAYAPGQELVGLVGKAGESLTAKIDVPPVVANILGMKEAETSIAEVLENLDAVIFGVPGAISLRNTPAALKQMARAAERAAKELPAAEAGMVKLGSEGAKKGAEEAAKAGAKETAEEAAKWTIPKPPSLEVPKADVKPTTPIPEAKPVVTGLSSAERTELRQLRAKEARSNYPLLSEDAKRLEELASREKIPTAAVEGQGVEAAGVKGGAKPFSAPESPALEGMAIYDLENKKFITPQELKSDAADLAGIHIKEGEGHDALAEAKRILSGDLELGKFSEMPRVKYDKQNNIFEIRYDADRFLRDQKQIPEVVYNRDLQETVAALKKKYPEVGISIPETGEFIPAKVGRAVAAEVPPVKPPVPPVAVPPAKPPTGPPISEVLPPKPSPEGILGNLQDADELVQTMTKTDVYRKIANLPVIKQVMHYLNPSAVANTPAEKVIVARAALREEGANKVTGAFARLEAIGKRDDVWGKLDDAQRLTEGKLKGKTLDEVLTYRTKYTADLTPEQQKWAEAFHELEESKLKLLTDNGIKINELAFEEGGEYVGRRVVGRTDANGELVESAFVGSPGPGRPGMKMGAEKARSFKDINEAVAEGYRYLPPDEALYLNLRGAYNRIADKQAAEWILDRIAYRTTGAPEALQVAALNARTKLWKSRQLEAALNRAVRGERIPGSTITSISETFPDEGAKLKALIPSLQEGKPVANEVQSLTAKAKSLTVDAESGYYKAVDARAKAREAAMRPRLEEAAVQAPAFAGKILTGPEAKETASVLNKAFVGQYGDLDQIIGAINKVNAIGRYFALAGDASPLMIQLIAFPARFPKVWGKSAVNFAKALFSVESQAKYLAANNDIIQKSRNLILTKGGQTEFTEAFRTGGIMQSKLAKAGRTVLEPFQRGFEAALDTAGIELRKAFDHMATSPQATAEIEQFINIIRGVTSSARIGVSPSISAAETAVFLAPRYNRASFALVSDIARGGIRGDQARKALGALIGAGAAMGTAVTLARGEGWEKVADHLDITNTREFMTWEVAGQRVGPGSKMRSLTVLLGKIIKDPDDIVKHATDFLSGNFSPMLRTTVDVVMGEDYIGNVTRPGKRLGGWPDEKGASLAEGSLGLTKAVIAENLLPLWMQSMLESGDLGGRIVRGGVEFMGGRAYPERDWTEEFRKLGLPVNDGYSVLSRAPIPVYETPNLYSDTARKLRDIETEKVMRTKEYPPQVKAVIEARDIKRSLDQYPNVKLSSINADATKGDTFQEYYDQWQERLKLTDEKEIAEFDKKYPKAHLGNFSQRQLVLLSQYHDISPTDTKGREQFLRDNPEIAIDPQEDYLKAHPDENAKLALWGQSSIFSVAAYDKVKALAKELDIPDNALPDLIFDGKPIPDDPELRKAFFEYQEAVAKFGSGQPETDLMLAKNDKLRELTGRKTPITTPIPALEIDVKNRKLNDERKALTSEKAQQEWDAEHPEHVDDKTRIEIYKNQFKYDSTVADKGMVEKVLDYRKLATDDEKDLVRLEDSALNEWLETVGPDGKALVPLKDKNIDALRLKVKNKDKEAAYEAAPTGEAKAAYLKADPAYARDRLRIKGYGKNLTGKLVETYADYYSMPTRKGYEEAWFLIEHPDFYQAMIGLPDSPWQPRDFRKVPSRAVYQLYQQYQRLPDKKIIRESFRRSYANLDAWMVYALGYKPIFR